MPPLTREWCIHKTIACHHRSQGVVFTGGRATPTPPDRLLSSCPGGPRLFRVHRCRTQKAPTTTLLLRRTWDQDPMIHLPEALPQGAAPSQTSPAEVAPSPPCLELLCSRFHVPQIDQHPLPRTLLTRSHWSNAALPGEATIVGLCRRSKPLPSAALLLCHGREAPGPHRPLHRRCVGFPSGRIWGR
jgi:hypothetical protein